MKHELSTIPLSIAKVGGDMHSTSKAELIDILKGQINIPSELPETDMKTCVLIDGHVLIKALGKPNGCQTFGEYADAFFNVVRRYFNVVFDRYIGEDSIKASTRAKRIGKTKPIRKVIDGPHVPLPHVWSNFISMDENKSDIANFLSEMIMQKGEDLPERWELVTGGGFSSPTDARSTRRQIVHLHGNHEESDTSLILHSCEAASDGYERLVLRCSDTDVLLVLFYFMPTRVAEVWMVSGMSTQQKCYPVHTMSNQFSQSVRENLLSFHSLTGCDTVSSFSGYGKKKWWKFFQRQPDSVSSIGRNGELDLIEQFVCRLYGEPTETDVNQAKLHLV